MFTRKRRMRACVVVERQEKHLYCRIENDDDDVDDDVHYVGTFENKNHKKLHEERTTKMKVCACIRADLRIFDPMLPFLFHVTT